MAKPNNFLTSALVLLAVLLIVPLVTMALFKDGVYYPHLSIETSGSVRTEFLFNARRSEQSCEALVANLATAIATVCKACEVKQKECLASLTPSHRRMLSSDPIPTPSARLPDGVVTYHAADDHMALLACRESERQSVHANRARASCDAPGSRRSFTASRGTIDEASYLAVALLGLVSAVVSTLVCYLLVKFRDYHGHLSLDHANSGPQKFHTTPTPRIGGLAILIGVVTVGANVVPIEQRFSLEEYGLFILSALPAFAGGFAEDITKKVGVLPRLACTMLAALCGAWLLAAVIRHLDVAFIDSLLMATPFAIAFTVFAVGGVANAINIIDGYNGVAAGYSVLVLAAIAWVASLLGDMFILTAALSMLGALAGFLAWNYPKGKIFLGDGGAYFLGFWLAELSVLLVARHDEVSPWFPMALLMYPVFETLFSIYRRKIYRDASPGAPDGLHLHQLIYMRLARVGVGSRNSAVLTARNSKVAGYIWFGALPFVLLATALWHNTVLLILAVLIFCASYVWLYARLVHWRAPDWLISRRPLLP